MRAEAGNAYQEEFEQGYYFQDSRIPRFSGVLLCSNQTTWPGFHVPRLILPLSHLKIPLHLARTGQKEPLPQLKCHLLAFPTGLNEIYLNKWAGKGQCAALDQVLRVRVQQRVAQLPCRPNQSHLHRSYLPH